MAAPKRNPGGKLGTRRETYRRPGRRRLWVGGSEFPARSRRRPWGRVRGGSPLNLEDATAHLTASVVSGSKKCRCCVLGAQAQAFTVRDRHVRRQAHGEASAREVGSRVSANLARDFELVLGEHRRSVHGGVDQQIGSQRLHALHRRLEDLVVAPGMCVGQRFGPDPHHHGRVTALEHGVGNRAGEAHALGAQDQVELAVGRARGAHGRSSSPASP